MRLIPLLAIACAAPPQPAPEPPPPPSGVQTLAFTKDLPSGHTIGPEDVEPTWVPEWMESHRREPGRVMGWVLREPVFAGDVFRVERATDPDLLGYAGFVPRGMRIIDLRVGGLPCIEPGTFVDVIGEEVRLRMAAVVRVAGDVVTVAVTPDQAAALPERTWSLTAYFPVDVTHVDSHGGRSSETELPSAQPGASGAIAARDLWPGIPIGDDDLIAVTAARSVPADAAKGRVPSRRILAGEPIVPQRLWSASSVGCAVAIPTGMRAVALPAQTEAEWLHIGALVDVIAGGVVHGRLLVLDVQPGQVTVVAEPEQALSLLALPVPLRFALRNDLDHDWLERDERVEALAKRIEKLRLPNPRAEGPVRKEELIIIGAKNQVPATER